MTVPSAQSKVQLPVTGPQVPLEVQMLLTGPPLKPRPLSHAPVQAPPGSVFAPHVQIAPTGLAGLPWQAATWKQHRQCTTLVVESVKKVTKAFCEELGRVPSHAHNWHSLISWHVPCVFCQIPSVPQVAETSPLKPPLHVALHLAPGKLLAPQLKVPLAGCGGLPEHTAHSMQHTTACCLQQHF